MLLTLINNEKINVALNDDFKLSQITRLHRIYTIHVLTDGEGIYVYITDVKKLHVQSMLLKCMYICTLQVLQDFQCPVAAIYTSS